ncbi:MAG: hypothetical protein ACHQYQ_06300, partial [Bacteriovoracales bacterium]
GLVLEKIEKISPTKRIFILSNENNSFNMGDFISLFIKNKPVARAIVAKSKDNIAGIKILKIYSQPEFDALVQGAEVQIVRGDDSSYFKKEKEETKETDLYEKTGVVEDELKEDETKKNFVIESASMLNVSLGSVEGINLAGKSARYSQLNGQFSWQFTRNFFVSILYGQNTITDFPNFGLDTSLYNITARVKWTANIFWGLVVQPYAGYQVLIADSPGAGQDSGGTISQPQLNYESALVNKLEDSKFIFGLSVLVRIVPGWYVQLDAGTDILNAGISVEI